MQSGEIEKRGTRHLCAERQWREAHGYTSWNLFAQQSDIKAPVSWYLTCENVLVANSPLWHARYNQTSTEIVQTNFNLKACGLDIAF